MLSTKIIRNKKGKHTDNTWIIIAVIAAALLLPQSPFYLFSSTPLLPSGQWLTNYNGELRTEYGDSWIDGYPLPLAQGASTFKILGYTVVEEKTGGERTETVYGAPYCQPNTCNGVASGTDADGCVLYAGTTTTNYNTNPIGGSVSCNENLWGCVSVSGTVTSCQATRACDGSQICGCRSSGSSCYQDIAFGPSCVASCSVSCATATTCGGYKGDVIGTETGKGCWFKATTYKDGAKINETRWAMKSIRYNFDDVTIVLGSRTLSSYTGNDCWRVENTAVFGLIPTSFDLNVTPSSRQVFETEQAKASVTIDNKWRLPAFGNLIVTFKIPTAIGIKESTTNRIVALPVGKSSHDFDIPTILVTNEVEVIVKMDVLMNGTSFAGLNGVCYQQTLNKDTNLGGCEYIKIGSFPEESFKVQVNPKPLYISDRGDCNAAPNAITGYECQPSSGLYIRSDVKSLTCVQIGCPVTPDKTYECTSAGICAETVFIYKDCSSGATCPSGTTCDQPSGTCINTVIFEKVVQCTQSSDCFNPCNGVSSSCFNNRCSYTGTCDITSVQCLRDSDCPLTPCQGVTSSCNDNRCQFIGSCNPTYLNIDCSSSGCPTNYACDTTFTPPVCKKTEVVNLDCSTLGCPRDYSCEKTNNVLGSDFVCSKTNTIYVDIDCRSQGKTCPSGFTCIDSGTVNGSGVGLCKKTDLITQNCVQLGCPSSYACSIDGVCLKTEVINKTTIVFVEPPTAVPIFGTPGKTPWGAIVIVIIVIMGATLLASRRQ